MRRIDAQLTERRAHAHPAQRIAHRHWIEAPRAPHRLRPQEDRGIARGHRIGRGAERPEALVERLEENAILGGVERLEVVPREVIAGDERRIEIAIPGLIEREAEERYLVRAEPGGA